MGIEASEAFLVGEVGPEREPHVGPWGQDHLLAGGLLSVCRLSATEGCQLLVLSFNLLAERTGECSTGLRTSPLGSAECLEFDMSLGCSPVLVTSEFFLYGAVGVCREPGEPMVLSWGRSGWAWSHGLHLRAQVSACACPACPLPGLSSVSMGLAARPAACDGHSLRIHLCISGYPVLLSPVLPWP